jgi:hypothetical protein
VSSADGTKLAAVTEDGVDVYATADSSKVTATEAPELQQGPLIFCCCLFCACHVAVG